MRDRPYFGPISEGEVEKGDPGEHLGDQSSGDLLLRPGEAQGLSGDGVVGDEGSNEESKERVRWNLGSVVRNISAADILKLVPE